MSRFNQSQSQGWGKGGGGVAVNPRMREQGGYARVISIFNVVVGSPFASRRCICPRSIFSSLM